MTAAERRARAGGILSPVGSGEQARAVQKRLGFSRFLVSAFAVSCGLACSRSLPTAPDATLLRDEFRYGCGHWSPSVPPAQRTLVDLFLIGGGERPSAEHLEAIRAAGARFVRRFNGPAVRVIIDVAAVEALYDRGRGPVNWAATVPDRRFFPVRSWVVFDWPVTPEDEARVEALGASIWNRLVSFNVLVVVVDDRQIPLLRALNGVEQVFYNEVFCLA